MDMRRNKGSFGGGFKPRRFSPVKVGEELDVKIEAVGGKGDGIAKKNGFVLFVPGVKEGDEVKIRVTKVLSKVGFAEVVGNASKGEQQEQSAEESPEQESSEESETPEESEEDFKTEKDSESFGEDEEK